MSSEQLTATLAERVMGWRSAPDRFLLSNRQWITRSSFQPFKRVQDAFRLLRISASDFSLTGTPDGLYTAFVRIGGRTGTASGRVDAATISLAIIRALGMDVEDIH